MRVDQAINVAEAAGARSSSVAGSVIEGKEKNNLTPDIDPTAQSGVQQAEALTQTWSKTSLRTIYVL